MRKRTTTREAFLAVSNIFKSVIFIADAARYQVAPAFSSQSYE